MIRVRVQFLLRVFAREMSSDVKRRKFLHKRRLKWREKKVEIENKKQWNFASFGAANRSFVSCGFRMLMKIFRIICAIC